MLIHPTLVLLTDLGLHGMATAFKDLQSQPEARALEHGDWLALLLEREATLRHMPRTLLTPHLGYVTDGCYGAFYGQMVESIERWIAGDPVRVLA